MKCVKFASSTALSAIVLGGYAWITPAAAQEVTADVGDENTIVVTGFRESLRNSMQVKRNAAQVSDSITAEDVGKFPDENVAESLSRITGVQVDRGEFGEASAISIRGLGPAFSRTFVNGRTVMATDAERSIDFRDLPSEFIARLDVFKSPVASQIEGGIGGVVEMRTARPFDKPGFNLSGSIQGSYSDLSESYDPRASAQISSTFADNTLGVLLSVQYQDRLIRQDTFDTPTWNCVASDLVTDCDPAAPLSEKYFRPRFPRQFFQLRNSQRLGFAGAVQWRPTPELDVTFDALLTSRSDFQREHILINGIHAPVATIVPNSTIISENNSVLKLSVTGAELRTTNRTINDDNDTMVLGLSTDYDLGAWKFSGDIAYSQGKSDGLNRQAQVQRRVSATYDYTAGTGYPEFVIDGFSENPFPTTGWSVNSLRNTISEQLQEEWNFRLDVSREFESGLIRRISAGGRYTSGKTTNDTFGPLISPRPRPLLESLFADPADALTTFEEESGINNFGKDLSKSIIPNWVLTDIEPLFALYFPNDPRDTPEYLATWAISERTYAGYVQFDFESHIGSLPLTGNGGVRVVNTEQTSSGFTGAGDPLSYERDYLDVLPSFNLRLDIVPDRLLVRLAGASVMVRPSFLDLAPRLSVNTTTQSGTSGNPDLDPFRAKQLDLSLEYYFGTDDYANLALFYKDVETFVQTETAFITVPEAGVGSDVVFAISRPGNGQGAIVKGFEVGYQHTFDGLPWPLDNLGMIANYTFTQDDASITNSITGIPVGLEGLSKHSFNLVGFYEDERFSARISYNWRDQFLQMTSGGGGTPIFADAFGQLDASASLDVTDYLTLTFEAKNLLEETFRTFEVLEERPFEYNVFGRRFFLGARLKL